MSNIERDSRPGGEIRPVLPMTELANPASEGIDAKSSGEIVEVIHREDLKAWEAVAAARPVIAEVVEAVVTAFRAGGRLLYTGAGTSGRLGVLDASECAPTFGVEPTLVQAVIAGGEEALRNSVEGAEDSVEEGRRQVVIARVQSHDIVCGIAASGTTPFVWGGLEEAVRRDATTVLITCNPHLSRERPLAALDYVITLPVGPEVVAGSTRMKSGTATKMVLNMITTGAMIRWGKVYDNLMVDVLPLNEKLRRRARHLVETLGGTDEKTAASLLDAAGGRVKVAVIMSRTELSPQQAARVLESHGGLLRDALAAIGGRGPEMHL